MSEPNDPQVFVVGGPRGRGRPRASEPGARLTIWIPASNHDHYSRLALKSGQSLSKTVADLLPKPNILPK